MSSKNFSTASIAVAICFSGVLLLWDVGSVGAATNRDRQAVATAKLILRTSAYSLDDLVLQLTGHWGYSTPEATYGADHSGANWNHEALLFAKENLKSEGFSRNGLIQRMETYEFTAGQAAYGTAHCGANWNTEAYRVAQNVLANEKVSKSALIRQLESSGFTVAQATYGASRAY